MNPELEARAAIKAGVDAYRASALESTLDEGLGEQLQYVVDEQACLIEGLAWAFYRGLLPWMIEEFELVVAEQEVEYMLGCTCKLGDGIGDFKQHNPGVDERCNGIGLMMRPDLILKRRRDGAVIAWDWKTSAYSLDASEFEHAPQLAMSCLAAEKYTGEPCDFYYTAGFLKGKRDFASKAEREQQGSLKKQQSLLCYAWYSTGAAPMMEGKWAFEYQRGNAWGKVPIWMARFKDKPEDVTNAEWWVRSVLPIEKVKEQLDLVGPTMKDAPLLADLLVSIEAHERDVQQRLQCIPHDSLLPAKTADVSDALNSYFPQSWDCKQWGRTCSYLPICKKKPGWEDPLNQMEGFTVRVPHHKPEEEGSND